MNPRRRSSLSRFLPRARRPSHLLAGLAALAVGMTAGAQPQPAAQGAAKPRAQEAQTAKAGTNDRANTVTLNFVNAELEAVVRAIGQFTGKTFIVDPRVKGTLNLLSEKPVSREEAYRILLSALRLHGAAVVEVDGVAKVVPEADAKLQGAATLVPGRPANRGDQIVTRVFRLNYESATNLVPVLRPLIAPNNTINAYPGNNTLVVTDYAENIERIGRIIAAIDTAAGSDLEVVPVKNGVASDLAAVLSRLLEAGPGGGPGDVAQRITILADPRTNSILIRSASPARTALARGLIRKLDLPSADNGNVHIVYLKNADALRLAQTLRAVISGDTSAPAQPSSGGLSPAGGSSTLGNNPSLANTPSNLGGGSSGGAFGNSSGANALNASGGAGSGIIQADPATNTLIITAPEPVYRNLRHIIDQLDVRRAQVIIESLIVEVTADKAAEFGIQWLGLSGNDNSKYRIGGASTFGSGGSNLGAVIAGGGQVLPGNGINVGIFRQVNGELTLGALARALESDANANILSVPNIITLDNEEGKIVVGQNVPFITGQFTTAASGGSGNINPFQTIERRDVGLTLRVKPTVSESGTVKMAIFQEVSSVQDTTNNAGIITNKRSIESIVQVDDGQVIVLGGLVQDSVRDTVEKVPGLGDVPVLGNLFRYDSRKRGKTNLMVFLRPYIVRDADAASALVMDRYDYMRRLQSDAQPPAHWALPDMNAPILPPIGDPRTGAAATGAPKPIPPREIGTLLSAQDTTVLQAAQFGNAAEAKGAEERIAAKGYRVATEMGMEAGQAVYRVRVSVNRDARSVDMAMAGLRELGFAPQAVPTTATQ